jgi:hypothetical protein
MNRSRTIVIALFVHFFAALISIPWFAYYRWSGLTIIGISILLIRFSGHAVGIVCIAKRLTWGFTFNRFIFGYYMVTSGFSLLSSFSRVAKHIGMTEVINAVGNAIFLIAFVWLFLRFRSDPSVRSYFERSSISEQNIAQS